MQSSLSTFDLMVQEAMIFAGIYYFIRYYKTLVFLTASSLLYLLAICYLLSRFSRIRLCATPQTAAHQASPSLGFSRQEHWSGLPFPPPMHESEKWKSSRSVVSDSSDPIDCSLPGSSVHGIFQAKVLEWGAIAFSEFINYAMLCYSILKNSPSFNHLDTLK